MFLLLQVTLFPNAGICVGIQFVHAAADGLSFNHFMKSWASICKKGGDIDKDTHSLPFHDRSVIKDRNNLELIFLQQWWNWASTWEPINAAPVVNKVRATFILNTSQIERLKAWLRNHLTDLELSLYNMSTFVTTCAFTWACLVKSRKATESESSKLDHFCFVADCRNRLDDAIPGTYFGNCLAICFVPLEKGSLLSGQHQHGIVEAAKAIARKLKEVNEKGALRGAERWMVEWKKVTEVGDLVTVAGSPRLRVYDTDFGWGKPRTSRVVQIDESGSIALSESRQESGVEIGLALSKCAMDAFSVVFENGLRDILSGK